jgi:hypothetical protein
LFLGKRYSAKSTIYRFSTVCLSVNCFWGFLGFRSVVYREVGGIFARKKEYHGERDTPVAELATASRMPATASR